MIAMILRLDKCKILNLSSYWTRIERLVERLGQEERWVLRLLEKEPDVLLTIYFFHSLRQNSGAATCLTSSSIELPLVQYSGASKFLYLVHQCDSRQPPHCHLTRHTFCWYYETHDLQSV